VCHDGVCLGVAAVQEEEGDGRLASMTTSIIIRKVTVVGVLTGVVGVVLHGKDESY
jgi:hypothetical protein